MTLNIFAIILISWLLGFVQVRGIRAQDATSTPTPTATATPTVTPTPTVSPTTTSLLTPTPSPTPSASPTQTTGSSSTSTPTPTTSPTPDPVLGEAKVLGATGAREIAKWFIALIVGILTIFGGIAIVKRHSGEE